MEAWKYGPVFPSIYNTFKYQDVYKVTKPMVPTISTQEFNQFESEIINYVQNNYAHLEGWKLSALTHANDTPWFKAWQEVKKQGYIKGYSISNKDIKNYYKQFIKE